MRGERRRRSRRCGSAAASSRPGGEPEAHRRLPADARATSGRRRPSAPFDPRRQRRTRRERASQSVLDGASAERGDRPRAMNAAPQSVGFGRYCGSMRASTAAFTSTLAGTTPASGARSRRRGSTRACGSPMAPWVSSVRSSSCRSTTAGGQLGEIGENLFQLVRVRKRPAARVLVDLEHALDDVGISFGEILAHVEDAPGVGFGLAVEEHGAALDLGCGHHRVEARPRRPRRPGRGRAGRPDAAAAQASRPFRSDPASWRARTRKMCGSVPRVTATRLPLRSATLPMPLSLRVTSAVHSGRE